MQRANGWRPRGVQRLGRWTCGGVPLKAYAILADATQPLDSALTETAQAILAGADAQVATSAHQGMGFAILHRGRDSLWLLLHWWLDGDICAQLLWRSPLGKVALVPAERPLMACIWELALIDHERRAYVRSHAGGRDAAASYLDDTYPQDFC